MTKPRTSRVGPYEIVALIGVGGMGEVYRAHDSRLKREVAIKFLPEDLNADAERRARFEREARTLASLNHPNIAAIYGLEEAADGTRGLVLELVEGPTLAELVARGPVATPEALSIAKQIADALAAAHDVGVVHRDLKPHNVKVRPDGSVKVLDFGLAKTLAPNAQAGIELTSMPTAKSGGVTQAGAVLGTPAYMSPEQTRGREVDQRSDVWAFGCVVYETLTGRRAFEGDDVADIIASVIRAEPDWSRLPADLPQAVEMLLRRCLEKDPARRLRSIGDVRFLIEDSVSRSLPPASRAPSLPPSMPASQAPRAQRRMPSNGVIMTIVGGLVAITAILFRPDGPVPTPTWPAGAPPQTPSTAAPAISAARSDRLPNSIAVLPLTNLSEQRDDAYFATGLHGEILNQLEQLRGLTVISQSSVMRYADNRPLFAEIADDLRVSAIMEGSVQYAGNRLSVSVRLVDPDTGQLLWSSTFGAERGNVGELFAMQTEIATGIAKALDREITAEERRRVAREATDSAVAYESYLRALEFYSRGEFADAIVNLDEAVSGDSRFVDALSLRGYIYAFAQISSESRGLLMNDARLRGRSFQTLALEDADRALDLDPDAGLALLTRAVNELFRLRYRAAGEAFERARTAAPRNPSVLGQYAQYWALRGEIEKALPLIEQALQLDPNGPLTLSTAASVFNTAELPERVRAVTDEGLHEAPESLSLNVFALFLATDVAVTTADAAATERFAELAAKVERLAPERGVWALMGLTLQYQRLGKGLEAERALDRYRDFAASQGVGDADWAQYHIARDDSNAAYEALERAVATYTRGDADPGFAPMTRFINNVSPNPASPLAEPRFQVLLDSARALTRE